MEKSHVSQLINSYNSAHIDLFLMPLYNNIIRQYVTLVIMPVDVRYMLNLNTGYIELMNGAFVANLYCEPILEVVHMLDQYAVSSKMDDLDDTS